MVQFGTSGWRGVVGREVTFRNVRLITQAVIDTVREKSGEPERILIGYDTRMLSEKFAAAAAQLIAGNGIEAWMPPRDTPAPVLSSALRAGDAAVGLMFTASHNTPEYNGLKVYAADGTLVSDDMAASIEAAFSRLEDSFDGVFLPRPQLIKRYDPKSAYLARLQELIDWDAIRASGLEVVVDPLFGTTREYLDHILLENQIPTTVIHNTRDPYFGGYAPECTSENLSRLRDVMRRSDAQLGLATDGDGDRFGILDVGARMKQPSLAIALIMDYLARRRGLEGKVGRTLATSLLIDAVAREHDLEVLETTVGFKNFGPLLADGTLSFAGEESAGLAWAEHLPERDGVLACLLVAEMVAVEGRSLYELGQRLYERVGPYFFRRTQVHLTERLDTRLDQLLEEEWDEVGGRRVIAVDRREGLKLRFENDAWILLRRAGTEPKIRLYAEAHSREEMRHMLHLARQLLSEGRRAHV